MKVAIFSVFNTALNPYIILFKEALELQGLTIKLKRNFNLKWLSSEGKKFDCIHLHWLDIFYSFQKGCDGNSLYQKIIGNRFVHIFLDFFCLMNFVLTFSISKAVGIITVFTVHDLYDFGKKSPRRKFQTEIARKIVFRFSDFIHVHNHYTKKLIKYRYRRYKGVFVIPHGNYIGYYENKITQSEARTKLGLPDNSLVFLFLGLLRPYKGLEDMIAAFKNLNGPDFRLVIAGKVYDIDNYASILIRLSDSDPRIKIKPEFIPNEAIQIYLKSCNFFVLPYKDITTSGAVFLALSFGRPIIAPSISSFPEIITPEVGVLYDPHHQGALTVTMGQAIKKSFSEKETLCYASHFDWTQIGIKLANLYRQYKKVKE